MGDWSGRNELGRLIERVKNDLMREQNVGKLKVKQSKVTPPVAGETRETSGPMDIEVQGEVPKYHNDTGQDTPQLDLGIDTTNTSADLLPANPGTNTPTHTPANVVDLQTTRTVQNIEQPILCLP